MARSKILIRLYANPPTEAIRSPFPLGPFGTLMSHSTDATGSKLCWLSFGIYYIVLKNTHVSNEYSIESDKYEEIEMNRRQFIASVGVGTASVALFGRPTGARAIQSKRPNIMLIIGDDMTCEDCEPYGSKQVRTPNIDRKSVV